MARHTTIIWFRQDLRLHDNPALHAAAKRGAVIPLYVWSPESEGAWTPGAATRWWLHHSLRELSRALEQLGSKLIIAKGDPIGNVTSLSSEARADSVLCNRRYEPEAIAIEKRVAKALNAAGVRMEVFQESLLFGPDDIRTNQGEPFKVFTPFWKACLALPSPLGPVPPPRALESPETWPSSLNIEQLSLLPRIDRATGIRAAWTPGERGALRTLDAFLERPVGAYTEGRDRPDVQGTSRLSPHLHFGEVSPRRVWHETQSRVQAFRGRALARHADSFLRQLGWREFAHHLLYHFPRTSGSPLRPEFSRFPWRDNPETLDVWRQGRTGYPIVDAGMRELSSTGWMHNRSRMVVASFLVKDLLVHWLDGAKWFWDTLVDADLANNTLGWQWTAGCGADAAPFFRVFNPAIQGEKFDPEGNYVRRWVPEIGAIPSRWIQRPWEAPANVLRNAGVELGKTYPKPVVDHFLARDRALAAFAKLKKTP